MHSTIVEVEYYIQRRFKIFYQYIMVPIYKEDWWLIVIVIWDCTIRKIKKHGMFLCRPFGSKLCVAMISVQVGIAFVFQDIKWKILLVGLNCSKYEFEFLKRVNVGFFGNDFGFFNNYILSQWQWFMLGECVRMRLAGIEARNIDRSYSILVSCKFLVVDLVDLIELQTWFYYLDLQFYIYRCIIYFCLLWFRVSKTSYILSLKIWSPLTNFQRAIWCMWKILLLS